MADLSKKPKPIDVGFHSMYFSNQNGEIALMCPKCGRWFTVDIDDYLPVHSRFLQVNIPGVPTQPEPVDNLCDGSYNTKGVKGKGKLE